KRRVELPTAHIKTVGTHTVTVRLHPEVVASIDVSVTADA
ncbi:MAG: Ribosomal protein C-terminal domain, partial [Frankiaceae bacterium]|nr:Ribosomal protein C-terminal domain [Frankiaceae bacterium]